MNEDCYLIYIFLHACIFWYQKNIIIATSLRIYYIMCCDKRNVIKIACFRSEYVKDVRNFDCKITRDYILKMSLCMNFLGLASRRELSVTIGVLQKRRNPRLNEITVNLTLCKSAVTIWSVLHMNAKGTAHLRRRIRPWDDANQCSPRSRVPIYGSFSLVLSGVKAELRELDLSTQGSHSWVKQVWHRVILMLQIYIILNFRNRFNNYLITSRNESLKLGW